VTIQSRIMPSCSANCSRTVSSYLRLISGLILPFTVDIPPTQVNILDGNAEDLIAECDSYEERIKSYGGIELFLGGIGEDGHIAFNEPGKAVFECDFINP
jgi:6-phosphogluconolactonase/glucosamine-6-phosphate isomerase/deaminase